MWLEDYSPVESSEWGSNSAEISEKYKESAKRSSSGIKRTRKDEKKAKKHDFLLANFLVEIILKPEFDSLHGSMFACMDAGLNSNFALGVLSLVYEPISIKIREISGKDHTPFIPLTWELQEFHDYSIPDTIKFRINVWAEDLADIVSIETSHVSKESNFWVILSQEEKVLEFMSKVFCFFLSKNNIHIRESKSLSYSLFILGEVKKTLSSTPTEEI